MSLVVQPSARVTGSPVRWAVDFAVGGALIPLSFGLVSWFSGFGYDFEHLAPVALAGATVGAAVGAASPVLLDYFRRGVPLWLLTILASVTGAAAMLVTGASIGRVGLGDLAVVLPMGAFVGAVFWLPYTFATVTGRPTWPVVLSVGLVYPIFEALQVGLFVLQS